MKVILAGSVALLLGLSFYVCYNFIVHNTLVIYSNILPKLNKVWNNGTINKTSSSVWCYNAGDGKLCTFKNLCYAPFEKQFVFILRKDSIISGIYNKEELQNIDLSSVDGHNLFKMKIAVVSENNSILSRKVFMESPTFLLWRFKMDNIMHVLHDDIIPLYYTYMQICAGDLESCVNKYKLAFVDKYSESPLWEWYNIFSKLTPLYLSQENSSSLICFPEIRAGLLRTSIWYQYGFSRPQGPVKSRNFDRNYLRPFINFVIKKFKIPFPTNLNFTKTLLLLNRKINRKILNEQNLLRMINSSFSFHFPSHRLNVINLDLSSNNVHIILSNMLQANFVVGMHGSLMILCAFLSSGSAVVELFPFGINPNHVSFFKAFTEIGGDELFYSAWVNKDENYSVPNPSAPPLLGGINHLSAAEQTLIKGTKLVPAVECCHNPIYLYRMFQDTIVGEDFIGVLGEVLLKHKYYSLTEEKLMQEKMSLWYFPAPVSNIRCDMSHEMLKISWVPPINANCANFHYEIVVAFNSFDPLFYTSRTASISLSSYNYNKHDKVRFWVKYVCGKEESPDAYKEC